MAKAVVKGIVSDCKPVHVLLNSANISTQFASSQFCLCFESFIHRLIPTYTVYDSNMLESKHCKGQMAKEQLKRKRSEEYESKRKLYDQARVTAFQRWRNNRDFKYAGWSF